MGASRLINTEEWSVIYGCDLVGWYLVGVRGFSFHSYAIHQARLCICTEKTWQSCLISLPCDLEHWKRDHMHASTRAKTCAQTQRLNLQ